MAVSDDLKGVTGAGFLVLVEFEGDLPPSLDSNESGEGFQGASGWIGVGACESSIRILHFDDQAAANERLRQRINSSDAPPQIRDVPPVVHHILIEQHRGKTSEHTAVGSYLSVVHTVTAPGYGDVVSQEIEESLESLELVEGYAGHIRGHNVALPDEIWALIFWTSPPILPAPPDIEGTSIEHYRRVE